MTSDQHTYTPPKLLQFFTLGVGLIIMAIIGFMNVRTHDHLFGRIADWAGFTLAMAGAVWLFSLVTTIVWAFTPDGSVIHARAFQVVRVAVLLSEGLNLGEHTWSYVDKHESLRLALLPILIVGSIPTVIDFFVIEMIAFVFATTPPPAVAAPVTENRPAPVRKNEKPAPPISEPAKIVPPPPVPAIEPPRPAPEPPVAENRPKRERATWAEMQEKRQAVVDQIAKWIEEIRNDPKGGDPMKILSGPELLKRIPGVYGEKNLLNCRRDAFEQLDSPAITIMTGTEEETA